MQPSVRNTLFLSAFITGIGLGVYKNVPYTLLLVLVPFSLPKMTRTPGLTIACLITGMAFVAHWRSSHATVFQTDTKIVIKGIVDEPPDTREDSIMLTVLPEEPTTYGSGSKSGRLLVKAPRYPEWNYGDEIEVSGSIESPKAFDGFNYPLYLERQRIYGTIPWPKYVRIIGQNKGSPVLSLLYRIKGYIEERIGMIIPEPEASLLCGILLGSKRSLPEDIQNDLKATGTSHIIAISGANITILLGLCLSILPLFDHRHQFVAMILISIFIILITGASASVVRGAVVACLGRYIRLAGRKTKSTPFIVLSMALLLLGNPLMLVADPGFQLSFAAFAGLTYFTPTISRYIEKVPIGKTIPDIIRSSFTETVAATAGTAPISLALFGQLSLLGIIVNPFVLWLVVPTTLMGLALIPSTPLPTLTSIERIPLWLSLHTTLSVISYFATFTFGTITI